MTWLRLNDGVFLEVWSTKKRGKEAGTHVFPYLKGRRGSNEKGLDICLHDRDYQLVSLDQFVDHLAKGSFHDGGRVRMRPRGGGDDGGYSIQTSEMSARLKGEIARRRRRDPRS